MADWQKVINFAQMISIIDHIEYLTRRHNCVVIPHWGALIAQHRPSRADSKGVQFIKPKREFGFNASINHNDGLLANSIVRKHGISYDEATRLIADSVLLYKRQLQSGNEVPFGKIGYFTLNENGQTEFMPFAQSLSNDEYFGLQSFAFKPLPAATAMPAHEKEKQAETAKVVPFSERNRFAYRALQVAASIAIILGIVFVASTPIAVDRSQQNYATMNVPSVKKATALPGTLFQQETAESAQESASESQPSDSQAAQEETGKYYLGVSTFTSEQKAREYIHMHPDIQGAAKIRAKGKQYRVYIQRGDDYKALYQAASNLPSQYGGGWVTTD